MNSPLAEIGAELRQVRESQQRSLDDLSQATLIHVRHLLAVEDGRDADLPEPFYVKNFIRKYANALGLQGDAMANRYWDTRPLPETPPRPPANPEILVPWWVFPAMLAALLLGAIGTFAVMNGNRGVWESGSTASSPASGGATESWAASPGSGSADLPLAATASGAGVASGTLGAAGLAAATGTERAASAAASPGTVAEIAATGSGVAPQVPASAGLAARVPATPPAASPRPTGTPSPVSLEPLVVPGRQIRLQTVNREEAWMQIVADGREVQSGVVPKGATRTWIATRSLAVRIGRPGVVTAKLGDRVIGSLGHKDAPVFRRTFLTREGVRTLQEARTNSARDAASALPSPRGSLPPPIKLRSPRPAPRTPTPGADTSAQPGTDFPGGESPAPAEGDDPTASPEGG